MRSSLEAVLLPLTVELSHSMLEMIKFIIYFVGKDVLRGSVVSIGGFMRRIVVFYVVSVQFNSNQRTVYLRIAVQDSLQ